MSPTNAAVYTKPDQHDVTVAPYHITSERSQLVRVAALRVPYARAKRLLDVSLSIAAIVVGAPLFVLAALLVKLSSPGPVIYKQKRVGLCGRQFTFYKFRSMFVDADRRLEELKEHNEASGPVFKMARDPRVTRFGRFIRGFSLDELPQFFNILKGDMSLVGPRPPLPREVGEYGPWEWERLSVTPGLTCLWQIGGRSDVNFEEWMRLDHQYLDNMSFMGDVVIILKTLPAVLRARGAR